MIELQQCPRCGRWSKLLHGTKGPYPEYGSLVCSFCKEEIDAMFPEPFTKITVVFEIDTTKVGKGFFEHRIKSEFNMFDGHGMPQIKVKNIIVPPGTKYWSESI